MPEVAGNAALLVDPYNVEEIKNAMLSIYNFPSLRQQLVEKGRARRKQFSWEKTADQVWESLQKAL